MRAYKYLPDSWVIAGAIIAFFVLTPIIAIGLLAAQSIGAADDVTELWRHLYKTVILGQVMTTLGLMIGVAIITSLIGLSAAWFITFYSFAGRRVLEWLLLLPLAIPTYIAAYIYGDLLDKAGPVYGFLVGVFGASMASIPYPQLQSLGGAIFILSAVLYPYVYLSARTSFLLQSTALIEAARALGASPAACFWRVALPMSRPALVVGISLALMECLNDIGAVEYLGVHTLTVGVYDTWLARGNLIVAAQMAIILLAFMGLLLWLERTHRTDDAHRANTTRRRLLARFELSKRGQMTAFAICFLPVLIGFIIPLATLVEHLFSTQWQVADFSSAARNSLFLALGTAAITVGIGLFLAYGARTHKSKSLHRLAHVSALGYAIPGTVLGLGMLVFLVKIDSAIIEPVSDALNLSVGLSANLFMTGSLFGLLAAYTVRFLTLSFGTIEAGLKRVPKNMDMVARSLGHAPGASLRRVHIPLLRATLMSAAILVFVDTMKELPATLILRPFDFETLATQVYTYASLGQIEEAALPALLIVLVGVLPVILATKIMGQNRQS